MTHNATAPVDADQSKLAAHAIKKRFDELNTPIKLNHAYEALAIAHRYPNWATMKAAIKPTASALTATSFVLGRTEEGVQMEIEAHKALAHIHAFSTSHHARRELLMMLSRNAIKNSSALVFVEPVSEESLRSNIIGQVLDMASDAKRSSDVFVVDLSHAQTRLGNSFNVLAGADDPVEVASLLMAGEKYSQTFHLEYAKVIEVAAQRAIDAVGRTQGAVLTAEMVHGEVEKLATGEASWLEGERWNAGRVGGTLSDFAKLAALTVQAVMRKYPRYFDNSSAWRGPQDSIAYGNILLIFVSRNPGDFEWYLEKFVTNAVKKAVMEASTDRCRYPDMLVCNDVDGFSSATLSEAARTHGVCLVLGDQCQTLPSSLTRAATRFRSDFGTPHFNNHYLLDEDGNRSDSLVHYC
ncbi:hypothetical protein OIU34_21235 [Pararhizobium sp. BT-229]|uniref:hypothetical protein n=1 Tax=Pararhizobium sp. BT-229 TaxID=2986923 RepID=UPI0021F7BF40|nr:hypothetical protein [Pararhizobium sp. BT-229]MCV9964416.1 hypothetical protein [Pararhizobium sp. BT-229]